MTIIIRTDLSHIDTDLGDALYIIPFANMSIIQASSHATGEIIFIAEQDVRGNTKVTWTNYDLSADLVSATISKLSMTSAQFLNELRETRIVQEFSNGECELNVLLGNDPLGTSNAEFLKERYGMFLNVGTGNAMFGGYAGFFPDELPTTSILYSVLLNDLKNYNDYPVLNEDSLYKKEKEKKEEAWKDHLKDDMRDFIANETGRRLTDMQLEGIKHHMIVFFEGGGVYLDSNQDDLIDAAKSIKRPSLGARLTVKAATKSRRFLR